MLFIWNALFYFFPALLCTAQFESCSGGSTSSAESTSGQRAVSPSLNPNRPLTAHEQLFGVSHDDPVFHHYAITSPGSSDVSPQLSPVFKSEAARAIVMEMSSMKDAAGYNMEHQPRRRAVPREKRRHHTVSSSQPLLDIETATSPIMVHYMACHFLPTVHFPSFHMQLFKTLLLLVLYFTVRQLCLKLFIFL
jgi:hypothetical protein